MLEEVRDRRLPTIQALRGVAASLVVFFHFAGLFKPGSTSQSGGYSGGLGNLGASGVDIFFVISGFIMVYTTKRKAGVKDALIFIGRRSMRIYPLYWIWTSMILLMRVAGIAQRTHRYSTSYILNSYLLIPSFNGVDYQPLLPQGWTLTFEMLFYLVFCLAILAGLRSGKIIFVSTVFAALAILSGLSSPASLTRQLLRQTIILEFLFGGLSAEILFRLSKLPDHRTRRNIAILLMGTGAVALSCTIALSDPLSMRFVFYGIPASFLVLGAGMLGEASAPGLLVYLGNSSYSIYLTHVFFALGYHTALKHFPVLLRLPAALVIVLAATATIALASLTYDIVERPLTKLLSLKTPPIKTEIIAQFVS
jgi:exopolysaccharide production protein ExoZ